MYNNSRGYIIEILDSPGNTVVKYKYDAWGNCNRFASSNVDLAYYNPIRYRSYYHDEDIGLYFLNARYYNPAWRRFISPDDSIYLDPESVNGLNLYAYCYNDPVNFCDPSGCLAISTVLGAIGGAISGAGAKNLRTLASIYDDMTGRAAQGVKALITAAQRYGFGSKQYALVNNLYGKDIQTAVNQGIKKAFVNAAIKIVGTTIVNPFVSMGSNSVVNFIMN